MRATTDILLVEDEADQAELQEMVLAAEGWSVLHAQDGEQALALLGGHTVGAILLDMVMPRMDGFAVLQALGPAVHAQPIVAMSSFPEFLPEAIKLGAVCSLPKPFEVEDLVGVVRRALAGELSAAAVSVGPAAIDRLQGTESLEAEELGRVRRLHSLKVMAQEPDEALDALAHATAELMQVPICLVSLVTESRQWWRGMCGITGELAEARGTPRDLSLCAHAVAARAPLVVSDARQHPVFASNPLVRKGVFVAYAGVPVEIAGVGALGTLCVLDRQGRKFTAGDLDLLRLVAERVAAEIEWREREPSGRRPLGTFRYLSMVDEVHGIYNAQAFRSFAAVLARQAVERETPLGLLALELPAQAAVFQDGGDTAALVQALDAVTPRGSVLGWLDDRAIAAAVPRLDEQGAWDLLCHALGEEATRRTRLGLARPPAVGAAAVCDGAFRADGALRALRQRLDAAHERRRTMTPGCAPPSRETRV